VPRVFITQQPAPNRSGWTPNLTPAAKYGALEFVFASEDKPFLDTTRALVVARAALLDFDPERDFVLWPNTGDPAAAWAVMLVLGNKGIRKVRTLYFERSMTNGERDGRNGFYTPVVFNL
jgi:hypothetical protein